MTTAHPPTSSKHFTIQRLADGIYAAIARADGGAMSNSGIVDMGGRTLIFDTMMTPQAAADLRATAETLTGSRVTEVVNSHWHDDHVRGNQSFPRAEIYATATTRDIIAERMPASIEQYRERAPAHVQSLRDQFAAATDPRQRAALANEVALGEEILASKDSQRMVLPTISFENTTTLRGTKREARLLTYGGGHTASDVVLHLPGDGVLFTGDLVVIQNHPWMGHGNPIAWPGILDQLAALDFTTLVPGHGPVGTKDDIAFMRRYLADIQRLAADLAARGVTPEDAATTPVPAEYADLEGSEVWPANLAFLIAESRQNRQDQ